MTDLELLELLEKAKEKQRGPQGPAGVGVERIEQFEDDSFTIKLTTGESKKIQLPVAKDGEVGPQGIPGNSVTGPTGSRGPAGADCAAFRSVSRSGCAPAARSKRAISSIFGFGEMTCNPRRQESHGWLFRPSNTV